MKRPALASSPRIIALVSQAAFSSSVTSFHFPPHDRTITTATGEYLAIGTEDHTENVRISYQS